VKRKDNIIFVCGTEYQLLIAFILSTTTYRSAEKTLVLSNNNRVSYAYNGAVNTSIWRKVILVDDSSISDPSSVRAIQAANRSDILHFFSFGFRLYNHIFGLMARLGRKIILTEEGLLTYSPKRSYENWLNNDETRIRFSSGFNLDKVSEIWICEPELFSDGLSASIVKIDIDSFIEKLKVDLNLIKNLKKLYLIDKNFPGLQKKSQFYFQQYNLDSSALASAALKLLDHVLISLLDYGSAHVRKHPALIPLGEQEAQRGPWELSLLLNSVSGHGNQFKNSLYFSNNSSAMLGSLVFNGGVGTFFYLYKLVSQYSGKSHAVIDDLVNKIIPRFPNARIYVPESWNEFYDDLALLIKDNTDLNINLNLDAIPRNGFDKDEFKRLINEKENQAWDVPEWIMDRTPSSARVLSIQTMLKANPEVGTLGVAVIVPNGADVQSLVSTLESLGAQHRPVDRVWLIGGDIPSAAVGDGIEIILSDRGWPKHLSDRIAEGNAPDFLWILYAGDRLVSHATLTMGEYRLRKSDPLVWYADEAVLQDDVPTNPMLKPDFNIDLLRSYPYVGRNLILSTAAIQAVGGLDERLADLAPIDLLWRLVEQVGPPVVGHIPEVLQYGACSLTQWVGSAETILWSPAVTQVHFERMGLDAQVQPGPEPGVFRIAYPLAARPLISIIIPTRDQLPVLQACIEGLMEHTAYANYELLIVDNGSEDTRATEFLSGLEQAAMDQVRVLRWVQPFNFGAISNFAVTHARGDVFLFLDNDIQFSDQTRTDWLERLLVLALRPEVGLVGSRLDLPDGRGVDQCGQVLGLNHGMGASFTGLDSTRHGYMKRMVVQQNVSALSGSCLMMRREVFNELGGFDAEAFPIFFCDTDLCIRARRAGYLLVLEPETGLLHMGGATRMLTDKFGFPSRPYDKDFDHLYSRLLPELHSDPNYHPACSDVSPGYSLSPKASRIFDPLPGRPLPVVLASHEDWQGCALYRILHPFETLSAEFRLEGGLKEADFYLMDVARVQPDTLILQGSWLRPDILPRIDRYRKIVGTKVALEFDDYVPNIPTRSVYRNRIAPGAIRNMRRAIENVDWLVVSTPELAQEYASFHDDIRVAKNGLHRAWWGQLNGQRRVGRKIRVGWAGGSGHAGDLAEVRSVVKELQNEVEWVFMGMKPDDIACEYHPGVSIEKYPKKLASLNLDLAIAPLEINQFNRCKSNLRILELGACGVPVICTDIEPYRCGLPVTLVRNRHQDWVQAIRSHVAEPDALAAMGDTLRTAVLSDWMLEGDFLDQWAYAWGCLPKE
jgi:GT2 family glycosyltransferase